MSAIVLAQKQGKKKKKKTEKCNPLDHCPLKTFAPKTTKISRHFTPVEVHFLFRPNDFREKESASQSQIGREKHTLTHKTRVDNGG